MAPFSYMPVRSLDRGARVALIAPSGPLRGEADLELAVANVRSFGWEPVVGAHVLDRYGYLAGRDEARLSDLNWALRDDSVDGVWCIRGGYGVTRIVDEVDFDAIRRNPKAIIGFSDVTALLCAVGRECQVVTYHGPTARAELAPFTRSSFERAIEGKTDPFTDATSTVVIRDGAATGRLAGGNLALLASLVGTRYFPNLQGGILIVEDVNEDVYRIDRMFRQLLLSGVLDGLAAIASGAFTGTSVRPSTNSLTGSSTDLPANLPAEQAVDSVIKLSPSDCSDDSPDSDTTQLDLNDILREVADRLAIPCIAGLPIGHISQQWTVPLGALSTLDTKNSRMLQLVTGT